MPPYYFAEDYFLPNFNYLFNALNHNIGSRLCNIPLYFVFKIFYIFLDFFLILPKTVFATLPLIYFTVFSFITCSFICSQFRYFIVVCHPYFSYFFFYCLPIFFLAPYYSLLLFFPKITLLLAILDFILLIPISPLIAAHFGVYKIVQYKGSIKDTKRTRVRLDRNVAPCSRPTTNVIGPLHECKKVCPCTKGLPQPGIRAWIKQGRRNLGRRKFFLIIRNIYHVDPFCGKR